MRFIPRILMIVGIFSVLGALSCIRSAGSAIAMIFGFIVGIALISLSMAVRHRRQAALRLGYSVIAIGLGSFIAGAFQYGAFLPPRERYAVVGACAVSGVLVGIFWAAVWKRLWMSFNEFQ